MRSSYLRMSLMGVLAATAVAAQAQNQFNGVNIYATGDNPPLDGFAPGTSASLQLLNDGTNGDTAVDAIWSRDYIPASKGTRPDNLPQWKVASPGFSPVSVPAGTDNSFFRPVPGQIVKFVFDTTTRNDGFLPDGVTSTSGYLYTVPSPVPSGGANATSVTAVGSFQSELGGSDWNGAGLEAVLKDDGVAPDAVANDGLYTKNVTGLPAGAYDFKVLINGPTTAFDRHISTSGFATGGGNFSMNVIANTDVITIIADCNRGRVKTTNNNPLASPGPPFFATSNAWGTLLNTSTQMYDDGTNGDITAGDGVYSRRFTVANITATTGVKVRQGVGPTYPDSGDGYPFSTTVAGQKVLVQFFTGTTSDGYSPSTRFVWTDPASRRVPTYVQAVGDFMDEFGGTGDWNANDSNFQLADTGTNGDAVAGDQVFAKTFANPAVTNKVWKAVGGPDFVYQFGGEGEGYTLNGNNDNVQFSSAGPNTTFAVDAVTGRIRAAQGGTVPLPTSPGNTLRNAAANAGVRDWSVY